jgi:hypothetical protein
MLSWRKRDAETAESMRRAFLLAIKEEPALLREELFSDFLAQTIEPEDLEKLEWESPSHIMEDERIALLFSLQRQRTSQDAQPACQRAAAQSPVSI